ncbi:MAG: pyridoxamine 5'-phosphate oxidase family protein [Bacteroidales bacterium]|jgi:uncharacterized protein YhbP (UPF0306 family)|nr:pyridoxamine 5'-phosphate oxidase family protein [Bacteroidales bacterium]MDD4813479.1 pyridoxamine 5'-phosphate oxidase family protein [Bacteroidales bacterium]
MDKRIERFIRQHHVLSLATIGAESHDGVPELWTSHVFYAYRAEDHTLVFTTDLTTRHGQEMLANPMVSGGIVLETKLVGKIRGLQLTGQVRQVAAGESHYRKAYLKRFPYAMAAKLNLWILQPRYLKFTDNRLGFGRKIEEQL